MKKYNDEYLKKFNWLEIQKFYNEGNFWDDVIVKFKLNNTILSYASKIGIFKTRSKSESVKLSKIKKPHKHTQETKDKISKKRKEYLEKNPDKVPYLLNHSRNESYPEKYFTDVFEKEGIKVDKKIRVGLYELDFSILEKKINIEIDGTQHYYDKKIVESDKRRTFFLEENGWDVIRIDWKKYQSLDRNKKETFIKNLKMYIDDVYNKKPTIIFEKKIKKSKCSDCGEYCTINSKRCNKCYRLNSRKVVRPSQEQLLEEILQLGYCRTGRKYGVSDNSIRKWIKSYKQ